DGAIAGVSQRGGAPGTRETNLLDPDNLVERVNAIVLTGGSAYGLDTATGVMKYLEEKKMGFNVGVGVVPIVPAGCCSTCRSAARRRSGRPPTAATVRPRRRPAIRSRRETSAPAPAPRSARWAASRNRAVRRARRAGR